MDIAGAKALKERLRSNGGDEKPPVAVDVPEDAPPVYHYLGVSEKAAETPEGAADEAPTDRSRSFLHRFRWISR